MPRGALRSELIACQRQARKSRRPRIRGEDRWGTIPNMTSIHLRLPEIDVRVIPDHWEGDLIKGARNASSTGTLPIEQGQLFEETIAADIAAMTEELAQLSEAKPEPKGQAKCKPLPPELPRTEIHHKPESTTCACGCQMKRMGEDVAEKLDHRLQAPDSAKQQDWRIAVSSMAARLLPLKSKRGLPGAYGYGAWLGNRRLNQGRFQLRMAALDPR